MSERNNIIYKPSCTSGSLCNSACENIHVRRVQLIAWFVCRKCSGFLTGLGACLKLDDLEMSSRLRAVAISVLSYSFCSARAQSRGKHSRQRCAEYYYVASSPKVFEEREIPLSSAIKVCRCSMQRSHSTFLASLHTRFPRLLV